MSLLIVESPSKCNIIQEYLKQYNIRCIATFGHFREIKSLDNISFSCDNVQVNYSVIPKYVKNVKMLRSAIENASEIILATDNDREGEAIAWHVCDMFQLNVQTTKRILFNEITERALNHAYEHPTIINMNLVESQMTRQIIDFMIGFKCSPLLWHIENNLSAGRCQSPALQIICDNQEKINNSQIEIMHRVTGIFTNQNIMFELNKMFPYNNNELQMFLETIKDVQHIFEYTTRQKTILPPQPLTTSKLQQESSNRFHYSPKETMSICQVLYEKGYITYMRTDSVSYSDIFLETIKSHIQTTFGTQYVGDIQSQDSNHVHAHEAIRVTDILCESVESFTEKESKMYHFIHNHTLQSCMKSAVMDVLTATIATCYPYSFVYECSNPHFLGWMTLSSNKEFEKSSYHYRYLINMQQNSDIVCKKVFTTISIHNDLLHYTEARLVNELESMGIGRPSTFASIVETIQQKKYVLRQNIKGTAIEYSNFEYDFHQITETKKMVEYGNEKQKLVLQPMGEQVNHFLKQHLSDILNYDYTKQLELCLDEICQGKRLWKQECHRFNDYLNSFILPVRSQITTPSKFQRSKEKENNLGQFNEKDVTVKRGKYGMYAVYGNESVTLRQFGNRPVENVTMKEIEKKLKKKDNSIIREMNADITIRRGVKGYSDYILVKKTKKPQCISLREFPDNYQTCDQQIILNWLHKNYGI